MKNFVTLYDKKRNSILLARRKEIQFSKAIQDGIVAGKTHVKRLDVIMGWISKRNKRFRFNPKHWSVEFWLNVFWYRYENFSVKSRAHKVLISGKRLLESLANRDFIASSKWILGIQLTKYLTVSGISPIRHRYNPAHFRAPDNTYLNFAIKKLKQLIPVEKLFSVSVRGSWSTNRIDLEGYGNHTEGVLSSLDLLGELEGRLSKERVPFINYLPHKNHLLSEAVNPFSDSGFLCSMLAGANKKKAFDLSVKDSMDLFSIVSKRFTVDTSIWKIGGRDRVCEPDSQGNGVLRSRAVLSPEFCVSQIAQLFGRKVTKSYQRIQSQIFYKNQLGSNLLNGRWETFRKHFNGSKYVISCDWSKFDQGINESEIVLAFAEIRSYFPINDAIDKIFLFMISGFIHTHILGDGGIIYRKSKGNPTGHAFTGIVNTIVNRNRWAFFSLKNNIELTSEAYYGDDGQIGCNDDRILDVDIVQFFADNFGAKIKVSEVRKHDELAQVIDTPDFLKVHSFFGLPSRSFISMQELLMFERKSVSKNLLQKWKRVRDLLYVSSLDPSIVGLLKDYCNFIRSEDAGRTCYNELWEAVDKTFHTVNIKADFQWFATGSSVENFSQNSEVGWLPGQQLLARKDYTFWKGETLKQRRQLLWSHQ
jgi:hypothetical protein